MLDTVEARRCTWRTRPERPERSEAGRETIQQKNTKASKGSGPVQVTGEYNYVQTTSLTWRRMRNAPARPYNDGRIRNFGWLAAQACRRRDQGDAHRRGPPTVPKIHFLFSGAYSADAGGRQRSAKLKGQEPAIPLRATPASSLVRVAEVSHTCLHQNFSWARPAEVVLRRTLSICKRFLAA